MAGKVRVTGQDQVIAAMKVIVKGATGGQAMAALRAGAALVVNDASRRAPYKTGTLRRSIHQEDAQGGDLAVHVGTDVEYAPYQEFGTSRMAARPFLRPALDENRDAVQREITAAIKDLLG